MIRYIIGGISDNGTKTPMNQDACFAGTIVSAIGEVAFAAICDGMGGMQQGELASATVMEEIRKWFYNKADFGRLWIPDAYEIHTEWEALVDFSNGVIRNYGIRNGISLGSTVVMLLITPENVLTFNVGDSRAYEINETMSRLNVDDSVVGMEIDRGIITEEEAKHDSRNNQLTQCVGILETISPHFSNNSVHNNTYLIASDGFYNKVSNSEIRDTVHVSCPQDDNSMHEALKDIMTKDRDRGECDDITAIAVRVQGV